MTGRIWERTWDSARLTSQLKVSHERTLPEHVTHSYLCCLCAAEIVSWLLLRLPVSSLSIQNSSQSTPLHWIALNYQLPVLQLLCPLLPLADFSIKNKHGKTAVEEAEEACESLTVPEGQEESELGKERVKREKVVGYLLGCMGLGVKSPTGGDDSKAEEAPAESGEVKVSDKAQQDAMKALEEQAQKIKLEQEEKQQQQQ